jgi:hypothetical protein
MTWSFIIIPTPQMCTYCRAYSVATIIRRVLDWQLDLLDHTQLQCIHVITHNSFSCSEDCCSNSATTAATNSYGVPCHYSLTGAAPLSNTELTITPSVAANVWLYSPGADHKENTSPISLLLEWRHYRNGPQRKCWSLPLLRCMATAVNKRLTVDLQRARHNIEHILSVCIFNFKNTR